jgi:hypothetical protein
MIHRDTNGGPAASKWAFINYIQSNLSNYTLNDVIIIVDGDDNLCNNRVFSTINTIYQENKCWMTFGNAVGKYCENNNIPIPDEWRTIRTEKWIYNHPRTFKLALALTFKEEDFKMNGAWLTKGTDRPIVYNCIELSGKSRSIFIDQILYNYVEHSNNSYKTINYHTTKKQINYICNITPNTPIIEDIHIVMCCWERLENLEAQIQNLSSQTVSTRIHLHLLNNNIETADVLKGMVEELILKYTIKISLTQYTNIFYGFQRFLYVRDILLKQHNIDYVIMIDDDQLFKTDWVESMYALRAPRTYTCWYGKLWSGENIDYWNGSLVTFVQCHRNEKSEYVDFHYGGTGGCIIDVSIFNKNSSLWETQTDLPDGVTVYNIEDLWLSFVVRKNYGWNIKRSFLPESSTLNTKGSNSQMQSLYKLLGYHKQKLLQYLVTKYGL